MARFYENMSDEDIREHIANFRKNFETEFGQKIDDEALLTTLGRILSEKMDAFTRQNFADFSNLVTMRMIKHVVSPSQVHVGTDQVTIMTEVPPLSEETAKKGKKSKTKKGDTIQ